MSGSRSDPPRVARRELLAAGATLLGAVAGCTSPTRQSTATGTGDRSTAATSDESDLRVDPLYVQASGAPYRALRDLAAHWNTNPAPDEPGWPEAVDLDADRRLADHFAVARGLDPSGERSRPPVPIVPSWSDPEPIARDLASGTIDVGATGSHRAPAVFEGETAAVDHVFARTGSAFVVSEELHEAGVTSLSPEEIRDVYAGEITNWSTVGGPDREPYVITGASGTPNRWIRSTFFGGMALSGLDVRMGRDEQRLKLVHERDDAIADLAIGLAPHGSPVDVVVDGTRYGIREAGYPTTHDAHCYTWDGTDRRESAFLDLVRSPVGRERIQYEEDLVRLPR